MSFFKDKTILVTGAGGSIGSVLCEQLMTHDPKTLVMFDNSELALYNVDRNIKDADSWLGDVSDTNDIGRLFHEYTFDYIFHAAAYKHVRICEENPGPAWRVNVQGTLNILQAAKPQGSRVILVSTDKAVRPTCVMGRTKERAEMYTRVYGQTVVRLGNVYGSSGSVVPLWKEQIAAGEPVTITHPRASRYFTDVDYAAAKILMAAHPRAEIGTLVLEMGRPVNLVEAARALGATEFKYIGLRPGEKVHEELFVGHRKQSQIGGLALDEVA